MTDWFRSWHGAPTDPKWLGIAKRAGVAPGIAVAVAWALMDRASQAAERGSIEGYDADGLACFFGCEPEQVEAIVAAMTDKGMIAESRLTSWERRQPKREDDSAQRVKAHRERTRQQEQRSVTHGNAPETEKIQIQNTDAYASDAGASGDPRSELFDEGAKTVQRWTGKSNAAARSFIGKLLKAASDDCISVLDKIRTADAERMAEPIAWVAAAVIPRSTSPPGKQTLGSIWTSEAKSTGILHDPTSTTNGRLDEGDAARHRGGADAPQHLTIAGDRARH